MGLLEYQHVVDRSVLYSSIILSLPNQVIGGDDCYLKAWDRRQGFVSPLLSNKRFDGGVTTIQSHALRENLLAVGR